MTPIRFLVAGLTAVGAVCGCAPSQGARGEQPGGDTLLAVNGTRLFVHREGAGEPVVVVHGGPLLDHGYLVEPLRPLGSAFELVFYDQRLSGRSDGEVDSASVRLDTLVADLEALRRTLGLGRIHLLAHSWGGLLAQRYATRYGEGLRSLVLVNSTPPSAELWQREIQAQAAAIEPSDTAGLGALRSSDAVAAGDPQAIEELLRRSFRPQLHDPSAAADLDFRIPEDYAARSRQFAFMRPDLAAFDLRDDLTAVEVPTLLVYGSDQVGWRIGRDALASALGGSRDIAIADAGHFPFLERPAEFRQAVRAFLSGVGESAGSPEAAVPDDLEQDTVRLARLRRGMVRRQIEARGVGDPAVLRAMRAVPRHRFVPEAPPEAAYTDRPLPIGYGQTISQPYIVAFMAEAAAIEPGDRVLEIGTGSGYGAAVLAELAGQVYTIEIVPELAERARGVLGRTGYRNVEVRTGNGWLGWPEAAPFDAIVVTAAPERVPAALERQLAVGGTMVIPVGDVVQTLRVLRKTPDGLREVASLPVRFVPMVGEPADTGG
jgi:protein-L-isoaspartate(D-aspartate) O-methyltransferase